MHLTSKINLLLLLLFLAACTAPVETEVTAVPATTPPPMLLPLPSPTSLPTITIPITVYIIDVPNPSIINGFYAQEIGGPNGIVPLGARLFFVMDTPSVHDERVSSHEIGHIFGLHHALDDRERLMYSGTNGMNLTAEEITVARYTAQGFLNRSR